MQGKDSEGGAGSASPFLHRLHHVAVVVGNLDAAVEKFGRLGFGPFVAYPPLEEYVELEVPDESAFYRLRIKVCDVGAVALQLIEGNDERTIYGKFLKERGDGIFHLGFLVDDVDHAEEEGKARGLRVLSRGRRLDGSGFTYFDTQPQLGVALLVRQNPPD